MVTNLSNPTERKARDYKSDVHPDWCPGCGDFGIVNAIQQAMADMQLEPSNTVVFSGVGCSSKTPHFFRTYGVHTLHGRSLPFSIGAKLANPHLNVVTTGGDGDGYGIGAGHFLNAGRRNVDMTYIVYNNQVYGLTEGQASPTLKLGQQPKSLALPNPNDGVNPLALAVSAGYTFVARSYAFDAKHLKETIKRAINHKGMSLVDVLQPCPTYNNLSTKDWYAEQIEVNGNMMPRVYDVEAQGYNGQVQDPSNMQEIEAKKLQAIQKVQTQEAQIPIGVFYQVALPTFLDRITPNIPLLKEYASAHMPIADANGAPSTDLKEAYDEFLTNAF